MVVREDADIGSIVVGDIHKKSKCVQWRLGEAIQMLTSIRQTQLNLLHCGLGLQVPTDDIADDVGVVRTLVGEFPKSAAGVGTKGFVDEVEAALTLEPLACIAPPPGESN